MPYMLNPANYTQTMRPNLYNMAYRRIGAYKGMGRLHPTNYLEIGTRPNRIGATSGQYNTLAGQLSLNPPSLRGMGAIPVWNFQQNRWVRSSGGLSAPFRRMWRHGLGQATYSSGAGATCTTDDTGLETCVPSSGPYGASSITYGAPYQVVGPPSLITNVGASYPGGVLPGSGGGSGSGSGGGSGSGAGGGSGSGRGGGTCTGPLCGLGLGSNALLWILGGFVVVVALTGGRR